MVKAATGSYSYEKVFRTIGDPGNQSCSEYIVILFLLGNWPVPMVNRNSAENLTCSSELFSKYSTVVTAGNILAVESYLE